MTNQFEHFFRLKDGEDVGAVGPIETVSPKAEDVEAVGGLVFDVDTKVFQASFVPRLRAYLLAIVPELELRQTSEGGNLHAVLRFREELTPQAAKDLYGLLRGVLLVDPSASWMTKARVLGSAKAKPSQGEYVVKLAKPGGLVDGKALLAKLRSMSGEQMTSEVLMFRAVVKAVLGDLAPAGDGQDVSGVCPLHGSGRNPSQCRFRWGEACCVCFGDCNESGVSGGKKIGLEDLLRGRVLSEAYADAFAAARSSKPRVLFHAGRSRDEILGEVMGHVGASEQVFLVGSTVMQCYGGKLSTVVNGNCMACLAGEIVDVVRPHPERGFEYVKLSRDDGEWMMMGPSLLAKLPEIRLQTTVPVLDEGLGFCRPGYNAASEVFYEGPEVSPAVATPTLGQLVGAMHFERDVDRVNFIGLMLTPLLGRRFMGERPMGLLVGNQPGIGKTTAAKIIGTIASANGQVQSISFTRNDEELEKQLATCVQRGNIILIDNVRPSARSAIGSPCLERTISDRTFNFRRLGSNQAISGDNCLQFLLTCNGGQLSPDLASRSVPIRLRYTGDPHRMPEAPIGDLVSYAKAHRHELVAELMGMVTRWVEQGAKTLPVACRFKPWASMLNGILTAAGYAGFLSTLVDDRNEGDEVASALGELADARPNESLRAGEWRQVVETRNLLMEQLAGKNERGRDTVVGSFLKNNVGRSVEVEDIDSEQRVQYVLEKQSGRKGLSYRFVRTQPEGEGAEPQGLPNLDVEGSARGSASENPLQSSEKDQVPNLPNLDRGSSLCAESDQSPLLSVDGWEKVRQVGQVRHPDDLGVPEGRLGLLRGQMGGAQ